MSKPTASHIIQNQWADLVAQLPPNLDELAETHSVLKYRRCIGGVPNLLRLAFGYSILDLSLRNTVGWGADARVCKPMSDVALLNQLRSMPGFLAALLGRCLASRLDEPRLPAGLRLVDATSLAARGSTGANWRINVVYDPVSGLSAGTELTPASIGERVAVSGLRQGDIVCGDRHYCRPRHIDAIVNADAMFVCRATRNLQLIHCGLRSSPEQIAAASGLGTGQTTEVAAELVRSDRTTLPVRLVIVRKTDLATEKAVRRLGKQRRKKCLRGEAPQGAIDASRFVFLLTNVPLTRASSDMIAEVYRVRWQIELLFKRWKSLLDLGGVRARGKLAETYILSKLVCAALIETALREAVFSPWGFRAPARRLGHTEAETYASRTT